MTNLAHNHACRPATPDDMDAVTKVLRQVFGGAVDPATLRQKFGGPGGKMVGSTVLTDGNRIVGFLGQIPLRAVCRGQEVLAVQGADIAILPDHRRFDVFLQLVAASGKQLRESGVVLAYGIANAEATLAGTNLTGVHPLAPVPLLVRALDASRAAPGAMAQTLGTRALALAGNLAERCARRADASAPAVSRIAPVTRFDARFDRLWNRIRADYPIAIVRDAAYLNWRFADRVGTAYACLCLESQPSAEVEGFAVLVCTTQGGAVRGRIVELVTPRGGDHRATARLLRAALDWFRGQRVGVADVWMFPHAHLRRILLRHGFLPRATGPGRFSVSLPQPDDTSTATQAFHVRNWFLSAGDSDTV